MPTSAASSSSCGATAMATIAPTTATFAMLLTVSNDRALAEDVLRAGDRVELLGSGLIAWADGFHLTWATLAATPATRQAAATGPTASATAVPSSPKSEPEAVDADDARRGDEREAGRASHSLQAAR